MAKSFDRNSYGSGRDAGGSSRPSARSGRVASPGPRRRKDVAASVDPANPVSPVIPAGPVGANAGGNPNNPYARSSYTHDYARDRKRKKRKKILIACLAVVLVAVLGTTAYALTKMMSIQGNLSSGVTQETLDALDNVEPGEPFYMLLLGTDKSQQRESGAELDGVYRADSIMLMRIDPPQKKVTAISLMRDTMVDMGEYGKQKLNAAYPIGGAAYTVEVVSELAGVPIAHYAEIDFDGFCEVVDTIGGIEVEVPIEINDPDAGGHLDAGLQTLNGEQALILSRSRHAFDEYGKGDEYRAANQRMVISAIAGKVLDSDLSTMVSTVETLSKYVTTDMSLMEILSLASSMRGMDMATDFYSCVNPTTSEYIDGVWWEIMDEDEWQEMLRRVEQGLPPVEEDVIDEATGTVMATAGTGGSASASGDGTTTPRRSGTVSVRNGTEIDGAGAAAAEKIGALGYTVDAANADAADYAETVVVYADASQQERAQEIVNALGVGRAVLNNNEYLFTTDFLVVIGADWSSVQ
ncbi:MULTISPECIES: LCP family protein [unclassified Adlercreutzia]|uniref:LCP family protein n=1 Tax=unclassified Adlercreutzia TaxID=2636013 RepID=UPI0013ECCE7B|nr:MULTISPECIES: LCP family protein [unclassified Adlercreutzia]